MSLASNVLQLNPEISDFRYASIAKDASVLTDIYQEDVNIVVWQNLLTDELLDDIEKVMSECERLNIRMTVAPSDIAQSLKESAHELVDKQTLCQYIELLGDMFCTLFELKRLGLRLSILDQAMCPKFHVDKVPCRLVSTLSGIATQWLPHDKVDRDKLGAGSLGLPDETSGIMKEQQHIEHVVAGDVVLLKGEGWYNNENGGAVHRSPAVTNNEKRLLLTLDFID